MRTIAMPAVNAELKEGVFFPPSYHFITQNGLSCFIWDNDCWLKMWNYSLSVRVASYFRFIYCGSQLPADI